MNEENLLVEQEILPQMPRRLGGWLCLDFTNTVDTRHGKNPHEYLTSYADLVTWGYSVDILMESELRILLQAATQHPAIAALVFQRALTLREALYHIFSASKDDRTPTNEDLEVLNVILSEGMAQARLLATDQGFAWTWNKTAPPLDFVLWSVARSAAELLTSTNRKHIKECPGDDGCGWLFVDTSRNHKRRWCDMEGCGNRAKARRHYERIR